MDSALCNVAAGGSGGHRPKKLPPRTKLKMLIMEGDEETLERILAAIAIVCAEDKISGIPQ